MKGIDIVYHADNNTMELKDAPDDLLIGTDGDDYATYLKFQIIDDEGILDGFSPYVLFEVESRPMIGLDESYTLNLTQDLLNKARYGKLPFMLIFKGKDSTIEIHSTNSLTLGIAHSIDADREVKDDTPDSELAIKYVEITYHAESRLMELTDMPDDQFVGTDGDDYATYLRFHMDDPDGLLTGYGARVEFDVSIRDENGDTYKPFIVIDESMSVPLIQRILSNVKYGAIPIQLAFKGTDSEGKSSQFYSLNKLRLSISDSIRAIEGIDVNDRIDLNSVINNVEYNPKTATFSFRQIDGGTIAVQLSDLSEEHFEVSTKDDLKKLNKAQNGDTATTLDDGKWYKLYGEYSDPQSWKVMSPSVKAVDDHISDRDNPHNVTKSQIGLGNVDDTSDIDKPISSLTQEALDTKADSKDLSELSKIVSEEIADRESSDSAINESLSNHVSDISNPHNVTKEQLGLEKVDNTSDVNKPISTATQEALDTKADKTTVSYLRMEFDEEVRVRSEEDTNIKADLDTKADKVETQNALDTKADKTTVSSLSNTLTKEIQDRQSGDNTNATAISTHATNKSNPHGVTKEQVGLGNVDNTSDADKPISTATQNALNLKADKTEISSLYRPKGSVATYNDLPTTAQIGDVYDVQATGMNYVWTGSKWDELGAIIDLSPYYTKTEVDSALGGKVSKSGDTMTGSLQIITDNNKTYSIRRNNLDRAVVPTYPSSGDSNVQSLVAVMDKNNSASAYIQRSERAIGTVLSHVINQTANGVLRNHQLNQVIDTDGSMYVTCPSPSDKADNSTKIVTTAWANQTNVLVHSFGNEAVDGVKTFSSVPKISTWAQILGVPSEVGWTKVATITKSGSALNRYCALIEVHTPYHRKSGLLNIWAFGSSVFTDCGADWVYNFGYTPNEVAVHLDTSGTVSVWISQGTNRTQTMFKCVEQYGMWGLDLTSWIILDTGSREFATALPTEGTIHYSTSSKVTTPSADATGTEIINANWSLGKFVQKTGDTMTGLLDLDSLQFTSTYGSWRFRPSGTGFPNLSVYANNDSSKPFIQMSLSSNELRLGGDNNRVISNYPIANNDNSKTVATTGWVNTASSVVHTYNAESILGLKTFKDPIHIVNDSVSYTQSQDASTWTYLRGIEFRDKASERMGEIRSVRYTNTVGVLVNSTEIITRGKDNIDTLLAVVTADDGQKYAYCPSTPSNATNNIIATADWSLGKFVPLDGSKPMTGELRIFGTNPFTTLINTKAGGFSKFIHLDNTGSSTEWVGVTQAKKYGTNGSQVELIALDRTTNVWKGLYIYNDRGSCIIHGVTPSSASDNSITIPTTAWISTADCIVHKTGNETIDGLKVFSSPVKDPQNDLIYFVTPNSGTASAPYYCVAESTANNLGNYNRVAFVLNVVVHRYSDTYEYAKIRVNANTGANNSLDSVRLIMLEQNASFQSTNPTSWTATYNTAKDKIQLWVKVTSDQFSTYVSVDTSVNRYGRASSWKLISPSGGSATLPSVDEGWIHVPCEDRSKDKFVAIDGSNAMTGILTLKLKDPRLDVVNTLYTKGTAPSGTRYWVIGRAHDNNISPVMSLEGTVLADERRVYQFATISNSNAWSYPVKIVANSDNSGAYMVCPTPASKSENSTQVATTGWVNTASSVVHTTGTEVVSGFKKFYNPHWGQAGLGYIDSRYGRVTTDKPLFNGAYKWLCQVPLLDKDGNIVVNDIIYTNEDNSLERQLRMFDSENVERTALSLKLDATGGGTKLWLRTDPPSTANAQEVVTANWTLGKFVQKSGDTMTNVLKIAPTGTTPRIDLIHPNFELSTIPTANCFWDYEMCDKNGKRVGLVEGLGGKDSSARQIGFCLNISTDPNTESWQRLQLYYDGTSSYGIAPTPTNKSSNSNAIATTSWISTADCIVHKTGNESVSGQKTFKDIMWRQISDSSAGLVMNHTKAHGSTDTYYNDIVWRDSSIYRAYIRCNLWPDGESIQLVPRNAEGGYGGEPLTVKWTSTNGMEVHVPYAPENSDGVNAVNTSWANNHFVKKTGGKVTEPIAFTGQVGNTQTEAGVYLGLDANGSQPNATISLVSENTATYIDMGAPNEDYGFRIIKWIGMNNNLAQFDYGGGGKITIPNASGTMALTSQIPVITASTTDIGEGSALATGTLYLVYE